MLWLNKTFLRTQVLAAAFMLAGAVQAQTALTIKGSDAADPFYLQAGAVLYIQGGINVVDDGGAATDYIQNNGTIHIAKGGTPNQSGFTNNVSGLQTYSTGQTTGEVIFKADNETQIIGGGGTVEFMKMTVNNTNSPLVQVNNDVRVNGVLNIGGLIQLQTGNLTLPATASLAGAPYSTANMIQADGAGQFIRGIGVIGSSTSFTFPVGDGTPNYTPATLTFANNTQAGTVGIKVSNSTEANNNNPGAPYVYLSRYWAFTNTLNTYSYTGTFSYPSANLSDISKEAALKLSRWNGAAWDQFAGSSASGNVLTETTALNESTGPLTGDFTGRTQCVNPTVYNVTGGTQCNSVTVGVSNSQTGVNYQLVMDGATNIGSPLAGSDGNAISFGVQNAAGTYTVVATTQYGACVSNMNGSAKVNPLPTVFDVTGGLCVPVSVGLEGSQTGISYQLVRNGVTNVGAPIAGTGNALAFPSQGTTGTYSVVATNNTTSCSTTMNGVFTVGICTTTWTGGTNTDWFEPSNWNPQAIPNQCSANVVIPVTSNQPVITGGAVSVGNVDIASGVTLTLQGQDLNVCGNWTGGSGSNAAVVGTGTVYLSGSSNQNIIGRTQFNILQLNNTNGAVLASGAVVSIVTGLHLQKGNLNANTGTLHLLSSSASNNSYIDDFSVSPVLYTGTISGSIVADRYIPVKGYNQHFISSPVSTPALTQINASGPDGQYVVPTNDCDETQSGIRSPYGSVFVYNDGYRPNGYCMLGNWMIKSAGSMENAKGYSTYLTGNTTLSLTGEANTGSISVNNLNNSGYASVLTKQGQLIESGWNLVGNPYPSALDMTVSRGADGFQNQVQVWVTSGPFSGSWQADVIDGISGHVTIPPFQAFMVRVSPLSTGLHSYPFVQSERTRTTNLPFYRTKSDNTLKLEVDYNGIKDVTRVQFNPSATEGFDDEYDANKPNGAAGRPTLYTMLSGTWYAINTVPSLKSVTTIPMGLRPEANGNMSITASGIETFDPTTYIYLEDKLSGRWHNLRHGAYTFATTTADVQSRFVLHFTPPATILTNDANCETAGLISIEQPGSANWNYSLIDEANNTISAGVLNNTNPISINATSGMYTLTLFDNTGYTVVKNIQVGGTPTIAAAFASSSSNAQVQENISFSSSSNAANYVWDFGDGSTATGATTNHSYQAEGVYTVSLSVTSAEACTNTTTRVITITPANITGLNSMAENKLSIWSHDNTVYIDFSRQGKVEAEVEMFDILGQLISSEKYGRSSIYTKQLPNLEAAYIVVKVKNQGAIKTRKVFISNTR